MSILCSTVILSLLDDVSLKSLTCSGGFKQGVGGGCPPVGSYYFSKSRFFVKKGYISLCAFAINEDGADKLSSAPPFTIFGSATVDLYLQVDWMFPIVKVDYGVRFLRLFNAMFSS